MADRLGARFRKAEMFDLSFLDQILNRAGNVFDLHRFGDGKIDPGGRSCAVCLLATEPPGAQ
jgi:hypothetical protein